MTAKRRKDNAGTPFGETQAVAYVRLGNHPTAGMADTGSTRSVIDREIAARARAVPLGKRGTMNIAGRKLHGQLMRVHVRLAGSPCSAAIDAFVPDAGEPFRKGVLLGMDFLQNARIVVDAETGESYCSPATDDPSALLARARKQMNEAFEKSDPIGVRLASETAWLAVASTADVAAKRLGREIPGGKSGRESTLREVERCGSLRTGSLVGAFRLVHDDLHGDAFYEDKRPSRDQAEFLLEAAETLIEETLRGVDRCRVRSRKH